MIEGYVNFSTEAARKLVSDIMKVNTKHCDIRSIDDNGTFALFESELNVGKDFYLIPGLNYNDKNTPNETWRIYEGHLQIWVLSHQTIKRLNNDPSVAKVARPIRRLVPLNYAKKLWDDNNGHVRNIENFPDKEYIKADGSLPGDDALFDKRTLRDGVCIALRLPYTSKPWMNKLINIRNDRIKTTKSP